MGSERGASRATDADAADIVRQFPSFIAVYEGAELRCVLANDVARAIVGGRDFEGLPLREALPEFQSQQIVDLVERVYASGEPASAREWRVQLDRPDGGEPIEVFANFDAVPWRGADGSLRGVITTGSVVTDMVQARRAAASQVAEAEQRFRRAQADIVELQRAMLPVHLPVLAAAVVVAYYMVAREKQAAGGDWFDCVVLPDERLAVVVGDVVGHGLEASVAMAQLRAVLTELLASGEDLPAALARLDRFAARTSATRGATVCAAVIDEAGGTFTYATMGHPSPLVVDTSGRSRFLPGTGGRPLGTGNGGVPVRTDLLDLDEVLLLFSDGLIERPGQSFEDGLEELAQVAGDAAARRVLSGGAPEQAVERVCALTVEVLTRTGTTDDVTVLGVQRRRRMPSPFEYTIDAADQLGTMRGGLGQWLADLGVDPPEISDLQLMATEAMTNALEHAYGGAAGTVALAARLGEGGRLHCEISDGGHWREPTAEGNRGRGLALIRHLSVELQVDAGPGGTVVSFDTPLHRNAVLIGEPPTPALRGTEPAFVAEVSFDPRPQVRVVGVVDVMTAAQLAAAIGRAGRGGTQPVVVDLTQTTQLASAGVRVLHDAASTPGGLSLRARAGSGPRSVLELVGLDGLVADGPAGTSMRFA